MDEVAKLTPRQVYYLYYRERDKEGRPKTLPYFFISREEKKQAKIEQFIIMGQTLGKTPEEIQQIIKEAEKNGNL